MGETRWHPIENDGKGIGKELDLKLYLDDVQEGYLRVSFNWVG